MDADAPSGPGTAQTPLVRRARPRMARPGIRKLRREFRPNEHDCGQPCLAPRANGHLRHHPQHDSRGPHRRSTFTPTRDIRARVRRRKVHVKRQKSRVERLPIRPLRAGALKYRVLRTWSSTLGPGDRAARAAATLGDLPASTIAVPLGRVAQWESARFTRERSQVRNPPRPFIAPRRRNRSPPENHSSVLRGLPSAVTVATVLRMSWPSRSLLTRARRRSQGWGRIGAHVWRL